MSQKPRTGFVKFENLKDECQDTEVLISSEVKPENVVFKNKFRSVKDLSIQSAIVFLALTILLILLSVFYFHSTLFESQHKWSNSEKNSTISQKQSFSSVSDGSEQNADKILSSIPSFETSCLPLENVDKVVITLVVAENLSCWDNATCIALRQKIEDEQDGLKYNFVIGAEQELYIGLGFKCRANLSENVLHIKVLRNDSLDRNMLASEEEVRVPEIIEQGIICGKILSNYSISFTCSEDFYLICKPELNVAEVAELHELANNFPWRALKVNDPNHEFGTLLHRDFKWIACGDITEETRGIIKSKVITLESINNCLPYETTTEISVDVVRSPEITCKSATDNSSCADVLETIEQLHDGLKYNFVIGTHLDLYVGLGFRCSSTPGSTLKIKILILGDTLSYQLPFQLNEALFRFTELIEQGRACGKISPHYVLTVNCPHALEFTCSWLFDGLEESNADVVRIFASNKREKYYDNQETHRKVIQPHLHWMACHRNNFYNTSETKNDQREVPSTVHPHDTFSLTTPRSHQYEHTTHKTTSHSSSSSEDILYSDISDYNDYLWDDFQKDHKHIS